MASNDITARFLDTVSWLIQEKRVQDKKEIAEKLGVSTSLMTEITKGRSNVGVIPLQNIVIQYGISAEWLLTGEGSMLKSEDISSTDKQPHKTQSTSSDDGYFDRLLHRIEELSAENAILKADLERIRSSVDNVDSDTSALAM